MTGWLAFPGGWDKYVAAECLEFATKEEKSIRSEYEGVKRDTLKMRETPPAYFNQFQFNLACAQADADANYLSAILLHSEHKLEWEKAGKWKHKQ